MCVCFHKHHKPSSIIDIPTANSTFVQYNATDFMAEMNLDEFAVIWPTSNAFRLGNRMSDLEVFFNANYSALLCQQYYSNVIVSYSHLLIKSCV